MNIEEIEEFIQGELSYLDLSTKQKEDYVKFIKKINEYYIKYNKTDIDIKNLINERIEDYIDFFKTQGFDDKTSIKLVKNTILASDRNNLKEKLAFLRILNYEEKIILEDPQRLRFKLDYAHARKMHLKTTNDTKHETNYTIIRESIGNFEKRLKLNMAELTHKYPVTNELKKIWLMLGTMDDKKLKDTFNLTFEQLSQIYPTTIDEVATLKKLASMSDEEIIEKYGINREKLLQKYPINSDLLKALISIKQSSDKAIENTFYISREELLEFRTITTEMIKKATEEKRNLEIRNYIKQKFLNK